MKLSIPDQARDKVLSNLHEANMAFQKNYPGEKPERQPVHTVYGGANLFKSDTTHKMGQTALKSFTTYAPDFTVLAKVLNLTGSEYIFKNNLSAASLESELGKLDQSKAKQ